MCWNRTLDSTNVVMCYSQNATFGVAQMWQSSVANTRQKRYFFLQHMVVGLKLQNVYPDGILHPLPHYWFWVIPLTWDCLIRSLTTKTSHQSPCWQITLCVGFSVKGQSHLKRGWLSLALWLTAFFPATLYMLFNTANRYAAANDRQWNGSGQWICSSQSICSSQWQAMDM